MDCKQEFIEAMERFKTELATIDQQTESKFMTEPEWWVDMMGLERSVKNLLETYKAP